MHRSGRGVVLVAACVAIAAQGVDLASATTPVRALADDLAFTDSSPEPRALAFATARRAGARVVRITLDWSRVAPDGSVKPPGFRAADPADPGYRWGYVEDAVRDAAAKRLRVVLVIDRAPAWAGVRKPDPGELGAFARAAARRFSGFYPDPKDTGNGLTRRGRSLPRVRWWQLWDVPNSGTTLQPVDGAADHYREMLGAVRPALRRVSSGNRLVTGGTTDDGAIAPLAFWRRLLCVSQSACPGKARFDVAGVDLGQRAPRMTGLARLRRMIGKPVWVTRVGWETPPLKPNGVSPATQARYLSKALYLADRAGVTLVAWNGLQDRVSYLAGFPSIASGLFFNAKNDLRRDRPKPVFQVYSFPFVVARGKAWGVAPRPGKMVRVQKRRRGAWRRISSARASRSGEFTASVRGRGLYRAEQAGIRSLAWRR